MTNPHDPAEPRIADHVVTPVVFFEPSIEIGKAAFGTGVVLTFRSCAVYDDLSLSVIAGTSDFDRSLDVLHHLSSGWTARKVDWEIYPRPDEKYDKPVLEVIPTSRDRQPATFRGEKMIFRADIRVTLHHFCAYAVCAIAQSAPVETVALASVFLSGIILSAYRAFIFYSLDPEVAALQDFLGSCKLPQRNALQYAKRLNDVPYNITMTILLDVETDSVELLRTALCGLDAERCLQSCWVPIIMERLRSLRSPSSSAAAAAVSSAALAAAEFQLSSATTTTTGTSCAVDFQTRFKHDVFVLLSPSYAVNQNYVGDIPSVHF